MHEREHITVTTGARTPAAEARMMHFIKCAARTATGAIGFIPWPKLIGLRRAGQVAVAILNDDLVGFVVHGKTPPLARIWQIWMRPDARRFLYGTALIQHVTLIAAEHDVAALSLRCACDLSAMSFWREVGFAQRYTCAGGKRRARKIAVMHRSLTTLERFGLVSPTTHR